MNEAKPFCISKWGVWEAYKRVKANKGAAGVDEQSIEDFEKRLKKNLYKIWNRMSSGSYLPPPVRTVKIPKANGGERKLGIPTVSDRIAQQVVKSRLEPEVDRLFHADSYGYRPGTQHRPKSTDAGGEETRHGSVEHSLYRALAESAHARRGWPVGPTGERHSARWSG